MRLPVDKADPAELMLALPASHVVAALVLFNIDLAARTLFSILADVLHAESLRNYARTPLHHFLTRKRPMAN